MNRDVFLDTSGFYALLASRDDRHTAAVSVVREAVVAGRQFVTTDYVLDETATLLKARGLSHLLPAFFAAARESRFCRVAWTDAGRFDQARAIFLRHDDKSYSFTDCVSFCAMQSLRLHVALTKDAHFRQAGFEALLAGA